jgi:hypothetical protein
MTHIENPSSTNTVLKAPLKPNLSIHSQRLSGQFERTAIQLRDLVALLDIVEILEIYDPKDDGFVFTETQIKYAAA